jgi:DNA-binding MarR family transcriptional regulator
VPSAPRHAAGGPRELSLATAAADDDVAPRAAYFLGVEGIACLSADQALAFTGLLETGRRLTRELEGELEAAHGLSFSALGLLGRLALAPGGTLRLSTLARDMGLSLSRVSRIVDTLEGLGLLERRPCPVDARAINACLTGLGATRAGQAQATHRAGVQERFFERLSAKQVTALVAALASLREDSEPACVMEG